MPSRMHSLPAEYVYRFSVLTGPYWRRMMFQSLTEPLISTSKEQQSTEYSAECPEKIKVDGKFIKNSNMHDLIRKEDNGHLDDIVTVLTRSDAWRNQLDLSYPATTKEDLYNFASGLPRSRLRLDELAVTPSDFKSLIRLLALLGLDQVDEENSKMLDSIFEGGKELTENGLSWINFEKLIGVALVRHMYRNCCLDVPSLT
jgi:hypothetical protein